MPLALLSPAAWETLGWVAFGIMVFLCFALGTVYISRDGHIDLFGNIGGLDELLFALALFVGVALVVAPFYGLWVIGRWVVHQFSPEWRQAHAEAVGQRQKKRNPRLEQDRLERRLAASKQRAAKRTAAGVAPAANPSKGPAVRE